MLDFFGNERRLRRLVPASANLHRRIAERARQRMQAIERGAMQLKYQARSQSERALRLLDEGANDIERQRELANAVLGLTARNLVRIGQEGNGISNAMPIARHAVSLLP